MFTRSDILLRVWTTLKNFGRAAINTVVVTFHHEYSCTYSVGLKRRKVFARKWPQGYSLFILDQICLPCICILFLSLDFSLYLDLAVGSADPNKNLGN